MNVNNDNIAEVTESPSGIEEVSNKVNPLLVLYVLAVVHSAIANNDVSESPVILEGEVLAAFHVPTPS